MFAGLTDSDFEAYAPKKWKSNMFNRERMEVRQKLLALGRSLSTRLSSADGSPLTVEASVEHPALWNHKQVEAQYVFFARNEAARKELDKIIERSQSLASRIDDPTPQHNHLFLSLSLHHDHAEIALRLHPDAKIDRQNLERKVEDHFEREKLVAMLNRLLPGFTFGVPGRQVPASDVVPSTVTEVLTAFAAPAPMAPMAAMMGMILPGAPSRLLQIQVSIPRAESVSLGAGFESRAGEALGMLLPLYQFVAWSRDNDYVLMRDQLQKEKQAKRQRGIAKNDEVRVVKGMFAGKLGVVQEIDQRGGMRLLVGKLAVKVAAEDVVKS